LTVARLVGCREVIKMEDFLKAFEESVGEGVEGIAVALVLMAMGVVISLLGAVLGENSAIYYWLIFLVIISLADIVVIFETAEEALKASVGYILGRAIGLLLVIWLGKLVGVSVTTYIANYFLLLMIFGVKMYLITQEQG